MEDNKLTIRPLDGDDLEDAIDLCWEVFEAYNAPRISDAGIREFAAGLDYDFLLSRMGDGEVRLWGAFYEQTLIGALCLRHFTHVQLLFVDGAIQKKTIGARLLKRAVFDCRMLDEDVRCLTVDCLPEAVGFFENQGFVRGGEAEKDGLPVIPMALKQKEQE